MRKDSKDGGSAVVASGVHQEGLGAHCEDRDGWPGVLSVFFILLFFPGARLDRVRDRAAGGQPHVVQAVWKTSWIPRGVRISSS